MRAALLVASFFVAMLLSGAAGASTVVILDAADADELAREAATRLAAELEASGFEVKRVGLPADVEPRSGAERAARATGAFAAINLSRVGGAASAEIWIADQVTGKTVVRVVDVRGPSAPSVLAVRAVELLRASLLEAGAESRRSPEPPHAAAPVPADVRRWMSPEADTRSGLLEGFGVQAAIGVLQSAGGIGPAVAPVLRLSYGSSSGFAGRLAIVGPAVGPELESPLGTASVRQELLALELAYAIDVPRLPLAAFASLGAGAFHLHATGTPRAPYEGASADAVTALGIAGLGVALRWNAHAALIAEGDLLVTAPRARVTLAGTEMGTAGRPSVLAAIGVMAAF